MTRRSLYFLNPRQVAVREERLSGPGPGQVLVKTLASAISSGTELLIYRGEVPGEMAVDESIAALKSTFSFPLKYGYAAVGQVMALGRQVFKHVLTGKARGIFQGKIFVRQGAQKTDGYQISQAVLLGEGAEFSAKPELEIYADDVKCSHGSTTGKLDETAMFYLRSRGVPYAEAEAMLVAAFAEEAFAEIDNEALAEAMRAHVARWMAERSEGAA